MMHAHPCLGCALVSTLLASPLIVPMILMAGEDIVSPWRERLREARRRRRERIDSLGSGGGCCAVVSS